MIEHFVDAASLSSTRVRAEYPETRQGRQVRCEKEGEQASPEQSLVQVPDPNETKDKDIWWRCAACWSLITPEMAKTNIEGQHEHAFTNPHGFLYGIKCFSVAPGCVAEREMTARWTWFTGYAWSLAACGICAQHLGWFYQSNQGDTFYGLIRDRLVESREEVV